jgi:hypothetical protein
MSKKKGSDRERHLNTLLTHSTNRCMIIASFNGSVNSFTVEQSRCVASVIKNNHCIDLHFSEVMLGFDVDQSKTRLFRNQFFNQLWAYFVVSLGSSYIR